MQNCTITIQSTLDYFRNVASLTAVLGNPVAGYGGTNPAINIANEVVAEILCEPFDWKWNRIKPPSYFVNQLQQDYSTSILTMGWIENSTRLNTSDTSTPQQIRGLEAVRELLQTSYQGTPFQIAWVCNSEAICGTWLANTKYTNPQPSGLGSISAAACPVQPFTQVRDTNGNIQVITIYGTTGSTQPTWNAAVGGITTDGTVTWTCIDPNGVSFRLSPLPPQNSVVWSIQPYFQAKPILVTAISQTWPIPDTLNFVYKQGFFAKSLKLAEDPRWGKEYALFEAMIKKAVGSADREAESLGMYPSHGLQGGGGSGSSPNDYTGAPPGTFTPWGW